MVPEYPPVESYETAIREQDRLDLLTEEDLVRRAEEYADRLEEPCPHGSTGSCVTCGIEDSQLAYDEYREYHQ